MKQRPLFAEDAVRDRSNVLALTLGIVGSSSTLSKAQKQFNRLIAKIAGQRQELASWNAFIPVYRDRFTAEITPLNATLRAHRIALVELLDRALDGKGLNKTQREKAETLLLDELSDILDDGNEPELIRLYDKHSDVSFGEEPQAGADFMPEMAASAFGVEIDDNDAPVTPEEMAALVSEKLRVAHEASAAEATTDSSADEPRSKRKKSAKALAREAAHAKVTEGATRSIREVYRKLVSELHPDREPDPSERKRKTELMQRVNVAYAAGDLLALLELQLSIEQINPEALANMAEERLAHFNRVLKDQSERLQDELFDITEPFVMELDHAPHTLTPDVVQHGLDADIRNLQHAIKSIQKDLVLIEDIQQLKAVLKRLRIRRDDNNDYLDALDDIMFYDPASARPAPRKRS